VILPIESKEDIFLEICIYLFNPICNKMELPSHLSSYPPLNLVLIVLGLVQTKIFFLVDDIQVEHFF